MTPEEIKNASDDQLRTRLAELKGTKVSPISRKRDIDAVNADRFDAMAKAYGNYDVDKSLELQQKSQELRDKKVLAEQKKSAAQDPDNIRFKIQSALNVLQGRVAGMTSKDPERAATVKLIDAMIKEQQLDAPSIKHAYEVANTTPKKTPIDDDDDDDETPFDKYRALIVNAKTIDDVKKYIDEATTNGIEGTELETLKTRAQERIGKLTPKADRTSTTKSEVLADIKSALSNIALGSSASTLNPSNAADAQILWKVKQRGYSPEAVNEGDLNLGRDFLTKAISKVTGVPPTIPVDEAQAAKDYIQKAIFNTSFNTLNRLLKDKKNVSQYSADKIQEVLNTYKWAGGASTGGGTGGTDLKTFLGN